jgi:superfamily II DNA or RNA helicase
MTIENGNSNENCRLRDLILDNSYSSSFSDLLEEFYLPTISTAVDYRRASGYFSSAVLTAIEIALTSFIENEGKIRIICSPKMTQEDADAISRGFSEKGVSLLLEQELDDLDFRIGSRAPSSIVRSLIARGVVDIRIALNVSGVGIYHDKYGVITDSDGDFVAFDGSVNETLSGWSAYGNHESFQVFKSWDDRVSDRAEELRHRFDRTWNGESKRLRILTAKDLPSVFQPRNGDFPESEALEQFRNARKFRVGRSRVSRTKGQSERDLQEHQRVALSNWSHAGYRGIISFVTGGGKTVTALSAARESLDLGKHVIILVPSELLVEQWIEEINRELGDHAASLIQVGAGVGRTKWLPRLQDALDSRISQKPALVVGTYDSAKSEAFLHLVGDHCADALIICDEVHALGAEESRVIMKRLECSRRLGLSATPERFNDPDGTQAIFSYFGNKVEPEFGIAEAIRAGRLVPYSYNIRTATLTDSEFEQYEELTSQIRRLTVVRESTNQPNSYYEKLLRDRANVIKNADAKISIATDLLKPKIDLYSHWLVYCNSISQIADLRASLHSAGIDSLEYHSLLSKSARKDTISYFTRNGGVLAAVHCLDQGVDIPKLDAAIIVASSTNPREYIQRRGRILRASPNKTFAELNDIIAVTPDGKVALRSDIARAREIGEFAENRERVLLDIAYLEGTINAFEFDSVEGDDSGD